MTQEQADENSNKLMEFLRQKFPDLKAHIDLINGTDKINISLFWNRKSRDQWNDARTYQCKARDYQAVVDNEIMNLMR